MTRTTNGTSRQRIDAGDVARMLGERIDSLVVQLLPGGRRDGRLWRCGSVAGELGKSLAVTMYGSKRDRWWEFNGQFGGDALDLVAACCCHGDIGQALQHCCRTAHASDR